jgi:signal transduction histidine kinase/PAS domain-containing protein
MMTPIARLYFSAFIIISMELMLLVYVLMLQPKLRSNQLFAVYMFALAVSSYNILVASTAIDVATVYNASVAHSLATMAASPLLWLLVLNAFIPQSRLTHWVTFPLLLAAIIPIVLGVLDWFTASQLLFRFEPALYVGGFVPIDEVLNGRFSPPFYFIYIILFNSLLVIPITWFAFARKIPERLRRAARILLLLTISVAFLYVPQFNISVALRNMLPSFLAALGAAWVVSTYRFFSPMELAMKQVIDTVTIGLLVFDEGLRLLDANAFSEKMLPIRLPQDIPHLTFPELFDRLMPLVADPADLMQLQTAVQLKPEHAYQQEIVLENGRSRDKTWMLFTIRPIYDSNNSIYLGLSCSVEDLTGERRSQDYIIEAHKAIEQYAYNQALLNDITQAALSGNDLHATLTLLASRLAGLFKADHCYISLWDEETRQPKPAVAYGINTESYILEKREPDETSISVDVFRQRQALAIEDLLHTTYVSANKRRTLPSRGILALPMIAAEQMLGTLLVGFEQPRQFTPQEVKWGEQIARQLALAIFKNRLLASEKEQRVLVEALQAAGQAMTSTLDFDQVMDRILEEIARVVPYDLANFALVNKGEAHVVRRRHFKGYVADPIVDRLVIAEMASLQTIFETKRPLLISNTAKSDKWVALGGQVKAWLGVPLVVGDELIAFLMVDKLEADFYQARHEAWLTAFASQAALALQHAQLFTEIQRRVTELEALSKVSTALRSSETVPIILQSVLEAMVDILPARVGIAFMLDETGTAVVSQASYPANFYPLGVRFAFGKGITGHVAQTQQLYITRDINLDPKAIFKSDEPEETRQLRSTIALPLVSEEGILGVIHLGLDVLYEFADDEIRTLKAMSNIVANGLQRIQVMQTLEARVASRTYDLETANERLQELDKLKSKFIADVSHELRTPVANLSIYIDLLQRGKPEKQARYLSVLQQQANRLTNLVEATLGLARLEIGNHNLALGPVMLNKIVEDILLGNQARAEAFGLELVSQLSPDLSPVLGNQTQLAQLVTNLVANAINYTQKGGQIYVETFTNGSMSVCLKVSDNGMGISEADLPHLFDRFYRGQGTGQSNIPGTGLGLAIVKEIIDLHQGKIDVTSRLNEGSTFLVQLPIYQVDSSIPDLA